MARKAGLWLVFAAMFVLVGANEPGAQYLGRIATDDLVAAAQSVLKPA